VGVDDTSDSSEATPVVKFEPLPQDENYQFSSLQLEEEIFVFSYLGEFLSAIQPYDFPVGKYNSPG